METVALPKICVPAKSQCQEKIRSFCREILREYGTGSPQFRRQLVLAIDEAVANIIEHAYAPSGSDLGSTIEIGMEIHPDRIVIRILDRGIPFDPSADGANVVEFSGPADEDSLPLPAVELYPGIRRSSSHFPRRGFGLHLIRLIMDEIEYQRTSRGENVLILTKKFKRGCMQ